MRAADRASVLLPRPRKFRNLRGARSATESSRMLIRTGSRLLFSIYVHGAETLFDTVEMVLITLILLPGIDAAIHHKIT